MALCDLHWYSPTLQKQVGAYVILPNSGKPPFATLYLLHGMSDDYTGWLRRSSIERYVENLPLVVVMPDGYRGYYTNNEIGPAYATYIATDLITMVQRNFPVRPTRSARCISGLSMGGYGAMRLSLGYPDLFASAHSHSGAVHYGSIPIPAKWPDHRRIFGANPKGSEHDLLALARGAKRRSQLPHLRLDCGQGDFFIEHNREFHHQLTKMGVPHEYEEYSGQHDWDYWDRHIPSAIAFHARNLKLKPLGSG
ncbi:MAG: esterase family protein [Phycisphaerales bacterium]|nr:esterase family protein [Phycisphaerales bacterium]